MKERQWPEEKRRRSDANVQSKAVRIDERDKNVSGLDLQNIAQDDSVFCVLDLILNSRHFTRLYMSALSPCSYGVTFELT